MVFAFSPTLHGLSAEFFRSPDISEDRRHPLSAVGKNGDFVTVGHFRGVLKQGRRQVCNGLTCFGMPNQVFRSQGWADIFLSKYNASRVLQWTRVAGGTGDDKGRVVNVDHDGRILVAGYITGVNAKFEQLQLSSRTALSRTIFLAKYSQTGEVMFVKEVASCATPVCDITSISQDETGVVMTGNYHGRTSFGTKRKCIPEGECITVEHGALDYSDSGTLKSTGSGIVFQNRCWLAKFDNRGEYLWHKDCNDPSFAADEFLEIEMKTNTYEQHVWASKAATFFQLNPSDDTGLLGRETNYEDYAKFRRANAF